jgi:hypothetical protein
MADMPLSQPPSPPPAYRSPVRMTTSAAPVATRRASLAHNDIADLDGPEDRRVY